jgi:sulfatase modifying factor 1
MIKSLLALSLIAAIAAGVWQLKLRSERREAARARTAVAQNVSMPAAAATNPANLPSCCMILPKRFAAAPATTPAGMRWIASGQFTMGSETPDSRPDARPLHKVKLDGFWMDETDVTNAQFRKFVRATGYVTTAERKPDWDEMKKQLPPGTPKPPEEQLVPASIVFHPATGPVPLNDISQWWEWVPGASWQHPEGPSTNIDGKDDYPVVQVSWDDAAAYAKWAGKLLPTEAQWEYAARGGAEGQKYWWGNQDPTDDGPAMCNTWQGQFPHHNTAHDGYERSSPVHAFKPNGYGLYDMAGNVWQWTADWYRADAYATDSAKGLVANPSGPAQGLDPDEPYAPKRVTRGGSFLCHASYCSSYRVAARMKTSPDSSTDHTGFRCVLPVGP